MTPAPAVPILAPGERNTVVPQLGEAVKFQVTIVTAVVIFLALVVGPCLGDWLEKRGKGATTVEDANEIVSDLETDLEIIRAAKVDEDKAGTAPLVFANQKYKNEAIKRLEADLISAKKYSTLLNGGGKPEDFIWTTASEARSRLAQLEAGLRNIRLGTSHPPDVKQFLVSKAKRAIANQQILIRKIEAAPDSSKR